MQKQDPKKPTSRILIRDFAGMAPSNDPHDTTPGESCFQVNVTGSHPGELRARQGYAVVRFEE